LNFNLEIKRENNGARRSVMCRQTYSRLVVRYA
jgi:hypothetical protein